MLKIADIKFIINQEHRHKENKNETSKHKGLQGNGRSE